MPYRGRFAPSPTGPLHAGSLLTAVASFLDAKAQGGSWLLRIEDLDPPRIQAGAETSILKTLEAYQLFWDETPVRQSERLEIYQSYLDILINTGLAYPCNCSRSELAARGAHQHYDGYCRKYPVTGNLQTGIRLLAAQSPAFYDQIQGQQPAQEVGDFIIKRRDGLFAYQLAVVIDDQLQQINHIMRGKDLLNETPKQLLLQQALNFTPVEYYAHLPLIYAKDGQKLSKQTLAEAIPTSEDRVREKLFKTLCLLGQNPPKELIYNEIPEIYTWAIEHWSPNKLPRDLRLDHNNH